VTILRKHIHVHLPNITKTNRMQLGFEKMKYRRKIKKKKGENLVCCFVKMTEKYINIYWDCAGLISKSKAFAYFNEMLNSQKYFYYYFLKTTLCYHLKVIGHLKGETA
jgi:hypothetical protein